MASDARLVRSNNPFDPDAWPAGTLTVSQVGDAWVVQAAGDFDLDDLDHVRSRFPRRFVTLDGDIITVWPRPRGQR